ncbi:MAG TPA: hypothetical protein VFY83_10915 [Anaerolineales bacterium]|nr:hypothetical protein [Anaerolineales bacterium]
MTDIGTSEKTLSKLADVSADVSAVFMIGQSRPFVNSEYQKSCGLLEEIVGGHQKILQQKIFEVFSR